MPRITADALAANEQAVRDAIDRLLAGDMPPGGRCDLKTVAALAGVRRTGFYPKKDRTGKMRQGPYQHLAEEFERRVRQARDAGNEPDPREAQVARLKDEAARLRAQVADRDRQIGDLTRFKELVVSRLAAQHDEITRLRAQVSRTTSVRTLGPRP